MPEWWQLFAQALDAGMGLAQRLGLALAEPIANESARSVLGSLGVVSSVLTFAVTAVVARPALVPWRMTTWRILMAWWVAILLCLLGVLYPISIAGVGSGALKLGVLIWAGGLIRLLVLVRQILLVDRSALSRLSRETLAHRFDRPGLGELGPPFLNRWAEILANKGSRLPFPLLLAADRQAYGLSIAQIFACAALTRGYGVVYLTFTRPGSIIGRQLMRRLSGEIVQLDNLRSRLCIIDCYSTLYLQEALRDRSIGALSSGFGIDDPRLGQVVGQCIRHCDPRNPVSLQKIYKSELRTIQGSGAKQMRVVYDSLSDFVAIADQELVVSYLRHMVVFEERFNISSLYITWPDALSAAVTDSYLSWFFTAVLRMRNEEGHVTAELENISAIAGRVAIDSNLDLQDRGFEIDRARVSALAYAIKRLRYEAIDLADPALFPASDGTAMQADYFFFLTAIDHRTSNNSGQYQEEIDGKLWRGSDLMYAKARHMLSQDPEQFTARRLERVSEQEVAGWFRLSSGTDIANPGLRAYLLRDAAQRLLEQFGGETLQFLAACDRWLDEPSRRGLMQRLADFRAYEDPIRKKSHLLAKLLIRRDVWTPRDPDNQTVAVDPVLVAIALRSGLISLTDQDIVDRIIEGRRLSQDVTTRLRYVTLQGWQAVSKEAGLAGYHLDDLLWGIGRSLFRSDFQVANADLRDNPYINGIGQPEAIGPFVEQMGGGPEAVGGLIGKPIRLVTPETYYY